MNNKERYSLFKEKFPLIKIFNISNKLYLYDAKSNLLTEVDIILGCIVIVSGERIVLL